jgi:hypothetical protein
MPGVTASLRWRADDHCVMDDPFAMNCGTLDRAIRVAVGVAVLSLAFIGPRSAWGYLGLAPLLTGAIGWCPLYLPFRVSTA